MVLRFYLRFGGDKEFVLYTSIYIHTPPSLPSLGAQLFVPVSISLEHHPSAQHSEKYPRQSRVRRGLGSIYSLSQFYVTEIAEKFWFNEEYVSWDMYT